MGLFYSKAVVTTFMFASLTLAGCASAQLDQPIGKQLGAEQLHQFVGEWVCKTELKKGAVLNEEEKSEELEGPDNERWLVRVLKTGDFKVACIKWSQEGQKFFIREWRAAITEFRGSQYLHLHQESPDVNLGDVKDGDRAPVIPTLFFARIRRIDDTKLEVQLPDVEYLGKLVQAKEIEGSIAKDGPTVTIKLIKTSLEKWMEQHPEKVDRMFIKWHKSEQDYGRAILYRVREAEDEQKSFNHYLVEPK